MKLSKKIVIFTMMLALPVSMWASVTMASDCQSPHNTPNSQHMQMEGEDVHKHMHDQIPSQNSNGHENCNCGCDSGLDCSVSGCSVSAVASTIGIHLQYTSQFLYASVKTLNILVDAGPLFRPPISLS